MSVLSTVRHKCRVDTYALQWHHLCFCDTRALADPVSFKHGVNIRLRIEEEEEDLLAYLQQ